MTKGIRPTVSPSPDLPFDYERMPDPGPNAHIERGSGRLCLSEGSFEQSATKYIRLNGHWTTKRVFEEPSERYVLPTKVFCAYNAAIFIHYCRDGNTDPGKRIRIRARCREMPLQKSDERLRVKASRGMREIRD
jgi:hypothetical protein